MTWPLVVVVGLGGDVSPARGAAAPTQTNGRPQTAHPRTPGYELRSCNRGWEARTEHFVVFATASPEHAVWAARHTERAWDDIARLADQWTDVHRQEAFAVGAVGVMLVDEARHWPGDRDVALTEGSHPATIYVRLAQQTAALDHRLPELRCQAFYAFLHLAGQHDALPDWVRDGLAAYVSGEDARLTRPDDFDPSQAASTAIGRWAGRPAQEAMRASVEDRRRAARWVRFLLEADDAGYAPLLFDAMSAAVAGRARGPHEFKPSVSEVGRPAGRNRPGGHAVFDHLIATVALEDRLADWLADPQRGQPILAPSPQQMPLDRRHREMVLILKLLQRFGTPSLQSVQTRVYEFQEGRQVSVSSATRTPQAMTPEALHDQLSRLPRWATIDTDGSLLVSNDQARLAQLFAVSSSDVRYRTYCGEKGAVLEATFPQTGETLEAWLEQNPENPGRPIARIRAVADDPLRTQ